MSPDQSEEAIVVTDRLWDLLARGGMAVSYPDSEDGENPIVSKYNGFIDPSGAAFLGGLLAKRAAPMEPNVVMVWEDVEDLALGFSVGSILSLPVVRIQESEGLVIRSSTASSTDRAVLVGDAFRWTQPITNVRALLEAAGGLLAGVVTLVQIPGVIAEGAIESLVKLEAPPTP
jgi:hypothetical protein